MRFQTWEGFPLSRSELWYFVEICRVPAKKNATAENPELRVKN
jgi:hypothetical protein